LTPPDQTMIRPGASGRLAGKFCLMHAVIMRDSFFGD